MWTGLFVDHDSVNERQNWPNTVLSIYSSVNHGDQVDKARIVQTQPVFFKYGIQKHSDLLQLKNVDSVPRKRHII